MRGARFSGLDGIVETKAYCVETQRVLTLVKLSTKGCKGLAEPKKVAIAVSTHVVIERTCIQNCLQKGTALQLVAVETA